MQTELEIPMVHLNGTSREELEDQVSSACQAVSDAIKSVERMHPNGRDYYLRHEGSLHRAEAQHRKRLEKLAAVRNELAEYYSLLVDS